VQDNSFRMIAKTVFGLEQSLADELTALGAREVVLMNRSVEFAGDQELMYRANLWSRLATRILKPIRVFRAANGDQLYQQVSRINWSRYLRPDQTLAIDAVVIHSGVTNSLFAAQKAKDAIVDQIRRKVGRRPSVDLNDPDLRLNLHMARNVVTLSLDSSGEPLSKRGYRTAAGEAPINEVLAAGILTLTGWNGTTPLVDAMCGSGTFLIEGAMKARNIAPGLKRQSFGFQRWPDFDQATWSGLLESAESKIIDALPITIVGGDSDGAVLKEARANAGRAGVESDLRLSHVPFDKFKPPAGPGVSIINPPYGERINIDDIEGLYSMIGDTLKKSYDGYDAFIFTANHAAAKRIGLRTSQRIKLFNPPLECRLLKFEIYQGSRKMSKATLTPPDTES